MELSNDLISQFVKATNDTKQENKESTVQGTVVISDGKTFVKLNNSEQLTPVTTTTAVKNNDKVNVLIKNHTATITGNITVPATNSENVANQINEFGILIGDKLVTEEMTAEIAKIDTLTTDNVTIKERLDASEADITDLTAENATITGQLNAAKGDIEDLNTAVFDAVTGNIKFASIGELNAATAEINNIKGTYATIENLEARDADITNLKTAVFYAGTTDIKFANIDFSNIGEAAIQKLFSDSGIIKDLVIGDGTVTGEIVGVTIRGDQIIAGTIAADKIVIRGDDGILYKLNTDGLTEADIQELEESETETETLKNSIHGSKIIAKTITAEKVSVSDLVAFGATIGGFNLTNSSLYSGVKSSVDNDTTGVYLDRDGQISVGDDNNYIKQIINTVKKTTVTVSNNEQSATYIILDPTKTYRINYKAENCCFRLYDNNNTELYDNSNGYNDDFYTITDITNARHAYFYIYSTDNDKNTYSFTDVEIIDTNDEKTNIFDPIEWETEGSLSYQQNVTNHVTDVSKYSKLSIRADDILVSTGSSIEKELDNLKTSASDAIEDIEEIKKQIDLKIDSDQVAIEIENAITNGARSVSTTTGYTFNENGLTVSKTDSDIKTTITENGMAVKKNDKEVLTANANGVNAKDLKASTYLIIGENSRFEDYGTDRTGCFWIGE